MKLKQLLLIGSLMIASIGSAMAANATTIYQPKPVKDTKVVSYFHKLLPTTTINSIYTTPYPDTYALLIGGNVIYGNMKSNYLTVGHMFDVYTRDDITDNLVKQNTPKIDLKQINIQDAVVSKAPSSVNKKLIVFIDPDCPYCRQLEAQIYQQGIDKKADIYYMLMPLPMHPNAKAHSTNIICSKDQIATLKEYMVNDNDNPKVTLADGCNIDPVLERIGSVTRSLSINGTPAIVTGDGTMIMGADIQAINEYINKK